MRAAKPWRRPPVARPRRLRLEAGSVGGKSEAGPASPRADPLTAVAPGVGLADGPIGGGLAGEGAERLLLGRKGSLTGPGADPMVGFERGRRSVAWTSPRRSGWLLLTLVRRV